MNLKMLFSCLLLALLSTSVAGASHDDINRQRQCSQCGMDRQAYGFSRALVIYEDGRQVGVCSLHCAVSEIDSNSQRALKTLLVADRNSHMLINAEKAYWVMGGGKRGVMTLRPKWAFGIDTAAREFVKSSGGKMVGWEEVLAAAREDAMSDAHR